MTILPRLLIVEDELIVAENMRDSLGELGYPIAEVAASGDEALRLIAADPPDLVLMDIRLKSGPDGIKIADRIRAEFGLPVIFVTAYADPALLERARYSQAYGIVLKPFKTNELHSTIQMAYSKWLTDKRLEEALSVSVQRQAEVFALLKSSHAVLNYQDFSKAARAIFDAASELIRVTAGYVAILSADGGENELLFLETGGVSCTGNTELPGSLSELRAEAYRTGRTAYKNEFAATEWQGLPDGHTPLRNMLFAPLKLDGVTVGMMGLANKRGDFTDHDAEMAMAFAEMATIALRNSRSLNDLNVRVDELNCLYGIARLMDGDGLSLPQMLDGTVKLIQSAWHDPANTAVRITLVNPPVVAQTDNYQQTPWSQRCDIVAFDHIAGVIDVCYLDEGAPRDRFLFVDEDRSLLTTVAERLGQFVERIEVDSALEQRIVQLMLINQIAEQVTMQLDLSKLLDYAAALIQERFNFQHVGLFMLDPATNALVLRAKAGEYAVRFPENHRIVMGQGLVGRAAKHGHTLFVGDVTADERFFNPFYPEEIIKAEISVPIRLGQEIVGVLDIQSSRTDTFEPTVVIVLETLAKQLAAAIQNARLYGRLQQHAGSLEQEVAVRTKELSIAYESLKELSGAKDEFLARVSHELRTPLTTLTLRHHLLSTRYPELRERYLDTLERETRRLRYIVDELLYVSEVQQTQIKVRPEPLDLGELVRLYVFDRIFIAETRDLTLRLDETVHLPPIMGDRELIERVLGILLDNAFNYTPAKGVITVQIVLDGPTWAGFVVQDNGYGIFPEEQDRIFERFYRGRLVREKLTTIPGAGLGLSIAREIIELHRGRIEVSSSGEPGDGTRVTVWLPI